MNSKEIERSPSRISWPMVGRSVMAASLRKASARSVIPVHVLGRHAARRGHTEPRAVTSTVPAWDPSAFRVRVQSALDAFLDEQGERLAPLGADATRLLAEARASVSGGKRFRAAFCYWGFHAVAGSADGATDEALVRACASLELLH